MSYIQYSINRSSVCIIYVVSVLKWVTALILYFTIQYYLLYYDAISSWLEVKVLISCFSLCVAPYWCAQDNAFIANGPCVSDPDQVIVSVLTDQTDYYDSVGLIDPVSNLYDTNVYIFHGLLDSVTDPGWFNG